VASKIVDMVSILQKHERYTFSTVRKPLEGRFGH
jgi:hypothetical protein